MADETPVTSDGAPNLPYAGCPVMHGFDPIEPGQLADPFPSLAEARSEHPVFYIPAYDMWFVTRYEEVRAIFSDPLTYSNAAAHEITVPMPADVLAENGPYESEAVEMLNLTDPPQHTRLRKLMQPAFTPKRVGRFEPKIHELADRLLDLAIDDKRMNIGTTYATPLISQVIAFILGIDPFQPEVKKFGEWMDSRFTLEVRPELPVDEADLHWRNILEWENFIGDFVARNREERGDNLTTDMMDARSDEGEPVMSDSELVSNVLGIQGAGSDSTANLIALTVNLLLRERGRWDAIVADPSLIPYAVEESLRHNGPVRGVTRRVLKDVQIGGVDIPAGSKVFLSIASANRDEEHFDAPDSIDIRRPNAREHLGFGLRTHFCVGAPLARVEARIAIERLVERIPTLRLAHPEEDLRYTGNFSVPGVRGLEVEWD